MSHQTTAPVVLEAPHADKHHMYSFWGRTKAQTMAMNTAISRTLNAQNLMPFHQVGCTHEGDHEPGYHAWEIWKPADDERLHEILGQIDEAAQEDLTEVRAMYPEGDYPEMYEPKEMNDHREALIAEHKEKAHEQRGLSFETSKDLER